jgi:UDP-3-O-[3-hydroxymyristoyl] glucosamine N-acyltransferase
VVTLADIAKIIGSAVPEGSAELVISGIKSPKHASITDVTFLSSKEYLEQVMACVCAAVIVKTGECIDGKICLEVGDPYVAYAKIANFFEDRSPLFNDSISADAIVDKTAVIDPSVSVGPGTVIGASVTIGKGCRIGARCVIERNSKIGSDCRIDSGVIIRWGTVIGNRSVIQASAVIGSDGFGNAREKDGSWIRIPAFGNVVIGDDTEVGAATTIDRGNFEPTIIGNGVKLDNLIHIAHNVTIDENTAIAAQTGISGSTKIGKRVIIGGQAGFVGHIEIGDDTFVGAKAGVSKGTPPKSKITGYPARDLMTMRRIEASQMELPALLKDIKKIKKQLNIDN